MREVPALAFLLDREADGKRSDADRRDHLARHRLRQHLVALASRRELHVDRELREIDRRRPQTRGSELGIDVPLRVHRGAAAVVRPRGVAIALGRERLIVPAARHPDRRQHPVLQDLGIWAAHHVGERELRDRHGTAGIFLAGERATLEAHLADVRRLLAVENLHDRRPRRRRVIAGKAEAIAGPRRVAREAAQRHRLLGREPVARQLPRFQDRVDVLIETEAAVLHGLQHGHRVDRFADRRGLKDRLDARPRLTDHGCFPWPRQLVLATTQFAPGESQTAAVFAADRAAGPP